MRQIQVIEHTFCDVCMERDGAQNAASELDTIRLTVNGRARRLDVCETHKNPTWNEITAYWTEDAGGPVRQAKQGKIACPVCHEPSGTNPRGVLMHMNRKHPEVELAERQRLAGMPVTASVPEPEVPRRRGRPRKAS